MRKEKDNSIPVFSETQNEANSPGDKIDIKQVDNIEENNKIIIGDKVKEYYQKKEEEILSDKPVIKSRKEITIEQESGLGIYLSDNILINGIILSEIIALPRALRPYDFQRYRRLR
ncbi:MAG: hypothetical protein PHW73_08710 [Atribacterota bacterium]|nr:hypothetical protein [Atribacterota bacterium]